MAFPLLTVSVLLFITIVWMWAIYLRLTIKFDQL